MAYVLSTEKQAAIIAMLAEGSSIRAIERITGVHRDRIMRPYAWSHDADGGEEAHITILHVPPVDSPVKAVRATIIQEFRNREAAAEA